MGNKYLEKIAMFPRFMSVANRAVIQNAAKTMTTSANSGLKSGPTVLSSTRTLKPRSLYINGNQLLNKIAEMVVNSDKSLPYRRRVEVAILKGDQVLLTKNKDKTSGKEWYGFPGGGTEGKTDVETAKQECLEEVGIRIKEPTKTEVSKTEEGINDKKGRAEKYRGSKTRYFVAEYEAVDRSKLGDDNDSVRYVWKTKKEALDLLGDDPLNKSRVQMVKSYLK